VKIQEDVVTYEIEVFTVVVILAYVKSCQIISCIDTVLSQLQPDVQFKILKNEIPDKVTCDVGKLTF